MHKVTKKDWGSTNKTKEKTQGCISNIPKNIVTSPQNLKINHNGIYRKNYRYTPTQRRSF